MKTTVSPTTVNYMFTVISTDIFQQKRHYKYIEKPRLYIYYNISMNRMHCTEDQFLMETNSKTNTLK